MTDMEVAELDIQGQVIRPGDAEYEPARRVWNHMVDKRPGLIVRCASAADVVAAVVFARQHDLLVAVRGGGHGTAGTGTVDGGIVIDLSSMNGVQVDPERRIVRVQAGATLGELDRATQQYGLATPTGNVSETGVAGLTLSGGLSHLRRKLGMGVDNLLAVEIVTADGRQLRASDQDNADLFWGARGGGGNFGIVTAFEFRLHEIGPDVAFLATMYPESMGSDALAAWRDWTLTAPDELSLDFLLWCIPASPPFPEPLHGMRVAVIAGMYAGPPDEGLDVCRPLPQLGEPLVDMTGVMPYVAVQSTFDPFFSTSLGLRSYWKSLYMDELSDEAIEMFVGHAATRPSTQTLVTLRHLGGAIGRVPDDAMAVANRSAQYLFSADSSWLDPNDDEANTAWTRQFWTDMHRNCDGGVYLNFAGLGEEGDALTRAAYGVNYDRLVALKTKYDPTNVFRLNHNIKPTG